MARWSTTYTGEAEFDLAHSSVQEARARAFQKWKHLRDTGEGSLEESDFYFDLMRRLDVLLAKFEARLIADKSQDAEPEPDEDEEDQEEDGCPNDPP